MQNSKVQKAHTFTSVLSHIDSGSLKKGAIAAVSALEGSGVAKLDRESGHMKVKKFGVVKAAFRPTKTLRKAVSGASAELLKKVPTSEVEPPKES